MDHTYPLPLNRLVDVYLEFAATDPATASLTAEDVANVVSGVSESGQVHKADLEKYNIVVDPVVVEIGMHVLAALLLHGLEKVGRLAWRKFWSRPKAEIVSETKVADNPATEQTVEKAIEFLREHDPEKLAEGWRGEKKE